MERPGTENKGRAPIFSRKRGEAGFSLVEILVAMTILSIGLLGMAALTVGVMKGNQFSGEVTTATTLASSGIEEMRSQGYFGVSTVDATATEGYGTISGFGEYKRVTAVDVDAPAASMKTVTVTVFWENDSRNVEMKTILSR